MPRRSKGDGSVATVRWKRADGTEVIRYRAMFRVARDPLTGKRKAITGVLRETKREAERDRRVLAVEIEQGEHSVAPGGVVSVSAFLDYWLEQRRDTLKYNSQVAYERSVRLHIVPFIGNEKLKDVTPTLLNRYLVQLSQQRPAPTVKKVWQHVAMAFSAAYHWQFIDSNPTEFVKSPSARTKERQVLSADQLRKLITVTERDYPHYYPLFLLLGTLGLRIGEALALRWSDVDGAQIHIQRTLVMRGSNATFGTPKTKNADRFLTLPPKLHSVLCALPRNHELVLVNEKGNDVMSRFQARRVLHRACDSANVPTITPHELRHTVASLWIANNEDLATVSAKLGHASIAETLKTYAHAFAKRVETSAYDITEL